MGDVGSRADRYRRRQTEAHDRVAELQARNEVLEELVGRLSTGASPTRDDVIVATKAAEASEHAADVARAKERQAHLEAADVHRDTADLLDVAGETDRAADQRRRADEDEEAGWST